MARVPGPRCLGFRPTARHCHALNTQKKAAAGSGMWKPIQRRGAPCIAPSWWCQRANHTLLDFWTSSWSRHPTPATLRSHIIQSPPHLFWSAARRAPPGLCSWGLEMPSPRLCSPKTRARPGCLSLWNAHCADSPSMTLVSRQPDSSQSKPESSLLMAGCPRRHSTFSGEQSCSWRSKASEPDSCCPRHVMLRSRLVVILHHIK